VTVPAIIRRRRINFLRLVLSLPIASFCPIPNLNQTGSFIPSSPFLGHKPNPPKVYLADFPPPTVPFSPRCSDSPYVPFCSTFAPARNVFMSPVPFFSSSPRTVLLPSFPRAHHNTRGASVDSFPEGLHSWPPVPPHYFSVSLFLFFMNFLPPPLREHHLPRSLCRACLGPSTPPLLLLLPPPFPSPCSN